MLAFRYPLMLLLLLLSLEAQAAGFAIWEMGGRASAMGGALVASTNDPTSLFYNPAGLRRCEERLLGAGLTLIQPRTEFSGHGETGVGPGAAFGTSEQLLPNNFLLPQLFLAWPLAEGAVLGLGFTTPYGLAVEWADPREFGGREIATFTDLRSYDLGAALAFDLGDRLQLGLGLDLILGSVELRRGMVGTFDDGSGAFHHDVGEARITGNSDPVLALNFGLLLELGSDLDLGLLFKTGPTLSFDGQAEFTPYEGYAGALPENGGARTSIPLPTLLAAGLAWTPRPELCMELDIDWIRWSCFETLRLEFDADDPETETIPEEWSDGLQFRLGMEYRFRPDLDLRAGFVRDLTPQPSASTGPLLPDANRSGLSFGLGLRILPELSVDLYDMLLFVDERQVRDNRDGFNGDYRSFSHLAGLALTWRLP